MRHKSCLFLGLWLLAAPAPAATTNTWIGGTFDWFTPANWSENRVPTDTDVVVVPLGTTVHMNSNAVFATLELYGRLEGDVHVRTALNCYLDNNGISGSMTIASNGVLNVWSGVLAGGTMVTNYGLVNLRASEWRWDSGAVWYNAPSALWDIQGVVGLYGSGATLINDGTIRCNSAWVQLFNVNVEHYGLIEATNSSQVMARGGRFLSDGRIFVDWVFGVAECTLALAEGHTVSGDGVFGIYHNGQDEGGVLIEDWIYGRLDWANGTMRGNIRIHSNAVLNVVSFPLQGSVQHFLEASSTITNYGIVKVSTAYGWPWGEYARFYNAPSGVIEIIRSWNLWWLGHRGDVNTSLLNEGTVRVASALEFWMRFTNAGVLELRGGALPVWGFFAQTAAGSTVFHLDGAKPFTVSATADLAGHLAVALPAGSQPTAGTIYEIMAFRDRVGEFQTFSGLGITPGLRFDVVHQSTNVLLRAVMPQNRVTQPRLAQNDFTFTFDGDADRPYDIETSTNLVSWHRLYTTNSQTGLIPFRDPEPFTFPHRFYRLRALP